MILTLKRRGVFPNYSCEIVAHSSSLDKRGFVVDNLEVDTYFKDMYYNMREPISWERMAMEAVEDIRKMVKQALRVTVTISPMLSASVTAEWKAPKSFALLYGYDGQ